MVTRFGLPLFLLGFLVTGGCKTPAASERPPERALEKLGGSDTSKSAQLPEQSDLVWVAKPDEAKSCATQKGISLDVMAGELEKAGVKVAQRKKLRDPRPRIQMCGVDRGDLNGFLISKQHVEKAEILGFKVHQNNP